MKKTKLLLPILLLSVIVLSACGSPAQTDQTTQTDQTDQPDQTTPTGYPSGEVQRQAVFADGVLYLRTKGWYLGENGFNGEEFVFVGHVVSEDNLNYPDEHLEASRTPVGTPVYRDASGNLLVINEDQGYVGVLAPAP